MERAFSGSLVVLKYHRPGKSGSSPSWWPGCVLIHVAILRPEAARSASFSSPTRNKKPLSVCGSADRNGSPALRFMKKPSRPGFGTQCPRWPSPDSSLSSLFFGLGISRKLVSDWRRRHAIESTPFNLPLRRRSPRVGGGCPVLPPWNVP